MRRYRTGCFDPPWPEHGGGKVKRGADRHYPLMKVREIRELRIRGRYLMDSFEDDSHMYLWATNNFLEAAFDVLKAWEFRYVTCVTWGKVELRDVPQDLLLASGVGVNDLVRIQTGLGQYFRGATEHLLFGVRGRLPYRTNPITGKRAQGRTLVLCPRVKEEAKDKHSRKPQVFYDAVRLVSPGPYLEGFARRPRKGWAVWGNEV